jgi:hypothetical protein
VGVDGDADCFNRVRVGDVEAGKGDGLVDEDGHTSSVSVCSVLVDDIIASKSDRKIIIQECFTDKDY